MKKTQLVLMTCVTALFAAAVGSAQGVGLGNRSIQQVITQLKPGQYVWVPELSPKGSALLVVNLQTQRAVLFRNGVAMAASTVSTGRSGNETPTGVFTILQKRKEHYSNRYNNAPMPNMQRLTWDGIALHAGKLPGYPASHGCIRLPMKFSALLFEASTLGMTVVITSAPAVLQSSQAPEVVATFAAKGAHGLSDAPFEWHPQRSPKGMVSVIVSIADQRAIVFRGGTEIGSAPVRVDRPIIGAMAYALRASDKDGNHWLKLQFSGRGEGVSVSPDEGSRFDIPLNFRKAVAKSLEPGSVIIITQESLRAGSPGKRLTVIENEVS